MIKNASEFKEFLFSQGIGSLGFLGGTPASRALMRASLKAAATAKAKASAATRRRDAYVTAFDATYAAPPIASKSENVVEEAFGEAEPAVPDAAELEEAHIEAGGAELGQSLEQQLEDVIDCDRMKRSLSTIGLSAPNATNGGLCRVVSF